MPLPWFTPLATDERPALFPHPFDELGPHPLARRAAEMLQARLRAGELAPGVPTSRIEGPDGGKMFGVLVAEAPDGTVGFLRSFSGMLDGRWEHDGYVPPAFDVEARGEIEAPGEALVKRLFARVEALRSAPELVQLREEVAAHRRRHEEALAVLKARHDANRAARHAERAQVTASASNEAERHAALHALDQRSRADKAERRRLEAAFAEERTVLTQRLDRLERRLEAADRLQRIVCRALMRKLHDTYVVSNAVGAPRSLRSLFARGEPPSGAGDCAAPKLLAFALANGFRPLALAEFWWGAPPSTGGRVQGAFYPACKEKCGPLLPFMLEGLQVAPPRLFAPPASKEKPLSVLFEDAWIVVVDKPVGLLSVPAKDEAFTDSVLARLRSRYPRATGPLLVHRLDLDTSGLLIAALDSATHAHLQAQFASREVSKRYVAWIEGVPAASAGTIELALRVDLEDRPRQIHDPVHGKPAVTDWRVVRSEGGRARVELFPRTGRTHQLRAHAAHPQGLAAPIVGDRLYGHEAERLLLHAESISFDHPGTGQRITFDSPAPF